MLGVSIASCFFIILASVFGMPISGTHTVIGALVGAGLSVFPASSLNWRKFVLKIALWFISPIMSTLICLLFFTVINSTALGGHVKSVTARLHSFTMVCAVFFLFAAGLVTTVAAPKDHYKYLFVIVLPFAFLFGLFFARVALTISANRIPGSEKLTPAQWAKSIFGFWTFKTILDRSVKHGLCKEETSDEKTLTEVYMNHVVKFAFNILLVCSASLVCLAHGSNDVANSIAPLLVAMDVKGTERASAYYVGGAGLAIGLITLGFKVMETVGKKVVKLDFYKAFSCEFATATCIILGTRFGIPLSTTHCAVGSLGGIIIGNKIPFIKKVYDDLARVDKLKDEKYQ